MMIVVPPFAERQQRHQPVVPARIARLVTPRSEQVGQRIDRERVVPQPHGAQAEAPDKQRPSADQNKDRGQNDRWHQVELVQPAQFGKFRKVADVCERRNIIFIRNKPADVRSKKIRTASANADPIPDPRAGDAPRTTTLPSAKTSSLKRRSLETSGWSCRNDWRNSGDTPR
jgi:hypothetical protein